MRQICYLPLLAIGLLSLLLGGTTTTYAQEDDFHPHHVQRDYFANKEQYMAADEELGDLYRKNGAIRPMMVYLFDDNSIEYVWPFTSLNDVSVINEEYNSARVRIGNDALQPLIKKRGRTRQELLLGGYHDSLSYNPEALKPADGIWPYLVIDRYRYDLRDQDKVMKLAAEVVKMNQEKEGIGVWEFWTFPYGYPVGEFEIVHFALDQADFEQRIEQDQEKLAGPEYTAWQDSVQAVITKVSTRKGQYQPQLSIAGGEKDLKREDLWFVRNFQLADGQYEPFMRYWKLLTDLSEEYQYDSEMRLASYDDQRSVMILTPIDSYAEIDRLGAKSDRMRAVVPQEKLDQLREQGKGLATSEESAVLKYHDSLSYYPDSLDFRETFGDQPYWRQLEFEYAPDDYEKARDLVDRMAKMSRKKKNTNIFEVYTYDMGGANNKILVIEIGKDKDDLELRLSEEKKVLAGSDYDQWMKDLNETLTLVSQREGRTRLDLTYRPGAE